MALQRAQHQAALGVSHADGAVVGAHQQHAARPLLGRAQAAHAPRPVALQHVQLLQGLGGRGRGRKRRVEEAYLILQ